MFCTAAPRPVSFSDGSWKNFIAHARHCIVDEFLEDWSPSFLKKMFFHHNVPSFLRFLILFSGPTPFLMDLTAFAHCFSLSHLFFSGH